MRVLSVLHIARIALFRPDKKSAAATPLHPAGTAPPPPNFDFEKAQALARANVTELALKISAFRLTDNERFELAKIAAAQSGEGTSFSIQNYKIAESSRRLEVARIALSSDARVLRYLSRYSLGIDDFNLACEFSPESFVDYARDELRKLNINPEFAGCLFLASRSREVAVRLFIQLMQEDNEALSKIPRPATNLPRYLLAKTIGLEPSLLYDRVFSSRAANALFELCVSLREEFRRPYFERVKLAPELFADRQLKAILLFLKGLERLANILEGRLAKHLDRQIDSLAAWSGGGESINLTAENIGDLTAGINRNFSRLFGQVFQIDGGSIAPDNIRRLEEAWGNIDVL